MKNGERILIFNVNWVGDVLFSTATIRNIRRNYPDSFIACIVPSRCYPVLKGNPHLDEVIIFDEKDRHAGIFKQMDFIRLLKVKNFDKVFLLHRSFSRALICRLAGIPERIGYDTKKRGFLLTKKFKPPKMDAMHRIDFYLNIIENAGLKVEDRYTEFFVGLEDEQFVDNFLKKNSVGANDLLAVINPGGNWPPKRWPKEYWAQLADRLIAEFKAKVVIPGAHNDISLAQSIKSLMKGVPVLACGALNLKQLAALAKRSDIFITADTGPLHIANAAGAKNIIALFGPTDPQLTGPYPLKNTIIIRKDVGCKIPCYEVHCKDNKCMKAITPEDVIKEVMTVIKNEKNK
ncbi:MAG: lipopolysaccharide heptosyltransferase II [Candidatus Omnitrophica bacterium]|nr:lipopolysaccharide heptosyltransferase II [Candidatus Omnitrophota bacterium]